MWPGASLDKRLLTGNGARTNKLDHGHALSMGCSLSEGSGCVHDAGWAMGGWLVGGEGKFHSRKMKI